MSDADILHAQDVLKDRINFRRDIRANDRFEIVLSREMVDDGETSNSRIDALRFHSGRRVLNAFLHHDGNYYDDKGESLSRAFRRYPTKASYRVSSRFNPKRLHPITKRIAPHNGVDFAMPTGTPILATGDGVVSRIGNHPYAGKYIEIRHQGQFKTRFLHLSRVLVKRGQEVRRGERVALSGNTGRSTGPHLHFELHVNNRPVDPLTGDIPTASRVRTSEMAAFKGRVAALVATMDRRLSMTASRRMEDESPAGG